MCSHPGCKPSKSTFRFKKGPAGAPPTNGWALLDLPTSVEAVREAWKSIPRPANGPTDAVFQAVEFLASNGIAGEGVTDTIDQAAIYQWCEPQPWRCGYGRQGVTTAPYLPWARGLWEWSNDMMAQATEEGAGMTLRGIVDAITEKISGPEGCSKCATHWKGYLALNPPDESSLEAARKWLWEAHNHTRRGKVPVPYKEIAEKFGWT